MATTNQESREWNKIRSRLDPAIITREILPTLQDLSLSAMSEATGLSKGYCPFIKRGIKIPHERHRAALRRVADS